MGGGIRVRARVTLLSTAEGGKARAVKGSYRPNHNFFGPEDREMTIGCIELPDGKELLPGESLEVPITFWKWPGLKGQIYPGRQWRIQEGPRLVGWGTVIEVLPD
jgi:translation elongation factor EF-Tu-like GTPase